MCRYVKRYIMITTIQLVRYIVLFAFVMRVISNTHKFLSIIFYLSAITNWIASHRCCVCNHITANITSHTLSYFHTNFLHAECVEKCRYYDYYWVPEKKNPISIDICFSCFNQFPVRKLPRGRNIIFAKHTFIIY